MNRAMDFELPAPSSRSGARPLLHLSARYLLEELSVLEQRLSEADQRLERARHQLRRARESRRG